MKKLSWFHTNKVLLIGLLSAVALPLAKLVQDGDVPAKILIVAGMAAATSFLARNLRGQIATIFSVVGTILATYFTDSPTTPISWQQIIFQAVVLFLGASSGPAKSVGYERTPEILEAKKNGEELVPTLAAPKPDKP